MTILDGRKLALAAAGLMVAGPALAGDGQPSPWQMGFQKAATPIMEQITSFHDFVNLISVLIALFVLVLLIYVMVRFNEKRHPQSSRTTHNTPVEIAWTMIPVIILVAIAIPSFRLLLRPIRFPEGRPHHHRHRQPVVLDLRISGPWHQLRLDHGAGGRSEARPAAPPQRRPRGRGAGEQERHRAGEGERRDSRLGGAVLRRQARRGAGKVADDLVQGRAHRHGSTASARSFAGAITRSCRSPFAW